MAVVLHKGNLLHFQEEEMCYEVNFVGCIEVKIGMGQLNKEKQLKIVNLCLNRVLKGSNSLPNHPSANLESDQDVALNPNTEYTSNRELILKINSSNLTLKTRDYHRVISNIEITNVSFVADGGKENPGYFAYIGKDKYKWRACYILQCNQEISNEIVQNIGRMFQVRFKEIAKFSSKLINGCGNQSRSFWNNSTSQIRPKNEDDNRCSFSPIKTFAPTSYIKYPKNGTCNNNSFNEKPKSPQSSISKSSIEYETWFHGLINETEVEKLLEQNGQYLVWQQSESPKQYVLSSIEGNIKRHFSLIDANGIIRTRNMIFQNVSHFINFHAENDLPIITPAFSITLRIPIINQSKIT